MLFTYYLFLAIFGIARCSNTPNNAAQFRIFKYVMNDYNKNVRPDDQVELMPVFSLKQVVSIDEKNQIMTSNSYVGLLWADNRLRWNSSDYNGVTEIFIPTNLLWMIDLFVINTAEANGYVNVPPQSLAYVNNEGYIYVVFSLASLKTRCQINVKYYPFDTQTCSVY